MQKLFILISLSLCLQSCGQNNVTAKAYKDLSQKQNGSLPWENLTIDDFKLDVPKGERIHKKIDLYRDWEISFYEQLAPQLKNSAYGLHVDFFSLKWGFVSPIQTQKLIIRFNLSNYKSIEDLTIKFWVKGSEVKQKSFTVLIADRPLQEIVEKLPFTINKGDTIFFEVIDYTFYRGDHLTSYQFEKESFLRFHFVLFLENGKTRTTMYFPVGETVQKALEQSGIQLRTQSDSRIDTLQGKLNQSFKLNFNEVSQNASFWRIFNSSSQALSFRPLPGQLILIKHFTLEDLRTRISTRRSFPFKVANLIIQPQSIEGAFRWRLNNIAIKVLTPYQVKKKVKSKKVSERPGPIFRKAATSISLEGYEKCYYYEYSVAYKEKKVALSSFLNNANFFKSKVIGKSIVLYERSSTVKSSLPSQAKEFFTGKKDKNCGIRKSLKKSKFSNKYQIKGTMEAYQNF